LLSFACSRSTYSALVFIVMGALQIYIDDDDDDDSVFVGRGVIITTVTLEHRCYKRFYVFYLLISVFNMYALERATHSSVAH